MSARDRASAKCADAPINTLEQFRARCAVVVSRYAIGRIDLIEAVDTLQDFAFTRGLVEEIGQDEGQRILTATVAPMLGKEPTDEYEGLSSTFARACLAADEQQQTRSSALLSERSQHHVPPSTLAADEFLVRLGDPERLRAWLAGHSAAERDDRWLDRYNDIGALVHSASVKFGEEQGSSTANDLRSTLRAYAPRPFSEIPRRRWLHAGHYIRQQVVMTIAPGGYGKTALILCNTTEMCTQKGFIGPAPMEGPLRVLYWNAEDPEDEVERRIAAICIHYHSLLQSRELTGAQLEQTGAESRPREAAPVSVSPLGETDWSTGANAGFQVERRDWSRTGATHPLNHITSHPLRSSARNADWHSISSRVNQRQPAKTAIAAIAHCVV